MPYNCPLYQMAEAFVIFKEFVKKAGVALKIMRFTANNACCGLFMGE